MAQTSMTVRMDAQKKMRFDELCSEFGMSANTAVNIFVNAVVQQCCIPFVIKSSGRQDAIDLWHDIRYWAESGNTPQLSLEEINDEISKARAER